MNLLLMIKNPDALEKGTLPSYLFDEKGGTVGACSKNTWCLDNYEQTIKDEVFQIKTVNREFCLVAKTDSIYINNSHKNLVIGTVIRLKTGDTIKLKNYLIEIKIINQHDELMTYERSLADILGVTDALLLTSDSIQWSKQSRQEAEELLTLENKERITDPIVLLEKEKKKSKIETDLMSFYDTLGIIPKTNLNKSLSAAESQDVPRTDALTVPMFVPSKLEKEPVVFATTFSPPRALKKNKEEEIKEILDPLELLGPPTIEEQ